MKKKRTPAQLQADKARSEKMKAKAEAIRVSPPLAEANQDQNELIKQIKELQQNQEFLMKLVQGTQTSQPTTRTVTKWSFNPKDYPDPTERFFSEKKLTLQGFTRDWFDIGWNVHKLSYEAKDGIQYIEPRFEIELYKIIPDPDSGEPSNKRFTVCRGLFFEDPNAALTVAHEQGLDVPEEATKEFLDEMRYVRMLSWLMEAFYPPKSTAQKSNRTETVIGNRLVEVFEVNTHDTSKMTFEQLKKL